MHSSIEPPSFPFCLALTYAGWLQRPSVHAPGTLVRAANALRASMAFGELNMASGPKQATLNERLSSRAPLNRLTNEIL